MELEKSNEPLKEVSKKDKELINELEQVVKPLQEWLRKNYDLMCYVIVDGYTAKVLRTEIGSVSYKEGKGE